MMMMMMSVMLTALLLLLLHNSSVAYRSHIVCVRQAAATTTTAPLLSPYPLTTSFMKLPFNYYHRPSIRLHATTKISSDSSKTRVRLLSDNKDLGKKGDIIMVSKAFWINVLQPKKGAEVITDTELLRIETEAKEASLKAVADAKEAIAQISTLEKISLKRKIGKNNKLFGTVTIKNILDELKLKVAPHTAEVLSGRTIAIVKIIDTNDPTSAVDYSKVGEIRQGGQFRASLLVHPSLEHVSFLLDILPE